MTVAITTRTNLWTQMTVHTVLGDVAADEVDDTIRAFYEGTPTKNILWDFTKGTVPELDARRLRRSIFNISVYTIKGLANVQIGGRAAIVVSTPYEYAMARVAITLTLLEDLPFAVRAFLDIADAQRWLDQTVDIIAMPRRLVIP